MSDENEIRLNILVADDDPEVLRSIKDVLDAEGFMAITANDGKEAYKLLQSDISFAAAIFDVLMPFIEGRELVRYMQSERRFMKIPVIMTTSESTSRLTSESLSSGAVAFLPKPFTDSQLKNMLQMFIKPPAPKVEKPAEGDDPTSATP